MRNTKSPNTREEQLRQGDPASKEGEVSNGTRDIGPRPIKLIIFCSNMSFCSITFITVRCQRSVIRDRVMGACNKSLKKLNRHALLPLAMARYLRFTETGAGKLIPLYRISKLGNAPVRQENIAPSSPKRRNTTGQDEPQPLYIGTRVQKDNGKATSTSLPNNVASK